MSDSHVDCGGPCETPRTDPTPQPAEAVAALAEAAEAIGLSMAHPWWSEVYTALTAAGWTLTRDHARCEALREAALAYRDLTVCYRTSKTPSEALFRRLAKADAALAARATPPVADRIQRLHDALHKEHPEDSGYDSWCVGDCHEDGTHSPEVCPPKGDCPRCLTCPLCPDWSTIDISEWDPETRQPATASAAATSEEGGRG